MFDVVVVGMGPNGLSVLYQLSKYSLKVVGLDKGDTCNHIRSYPKDMIFFSTSEKLTLDGFEMKSKNGSNPTLKEACDYYESFAARHNLNILNFSEVESVSGEDNDFTLSLKDGQKVHTRKVVLTTGIYSNPNYLNVPGEDSSNVSHYFSGSSLIKNKNVLIVGAGNSAVEAALDLSKNNNVLLSCRRSSPNPSRIKKWIYPDFLNSINSKKITLLGDSSLTSLENSHASFKVQNSLIFNFDFDHCFLLTGYRPDKKFLINGCGLRLEGDLQIPKHNIKTYETELKGIYVGGALVEGMNNHRVFIENGRLHGKPIAEDIYAKI
tara:strand:+ start:20479 stop:21447 length:969 start_codon:yes stop_codon:yes gene_type:complete